MLAIDGDGEEFSILEPPVEAKVSTIIPQASQLVTAVASALTEVGKAKATPDGTLNVGCVREWDVLRGEMCGGLRGGMCGGLRGGTPC